MKKWFWCLVALAFATHLVAGEAETPRQCLSNRDVLDYKKGGISDELIIVALDARVLCLDTSGTGVAELKKQGVSDVVLRAILSRPDPTTASPPRSAALQTSTNPAEPYVTIGASTPPRILPPAHAEISKVSGKNAGTDFASLVAADEVQSLALEVGTKAALDIGLKAGSRAGGMAVNSMFRALTFLKPATSVTCLLALPGGASKNILAKSDERIELHYENIPGVDPDRYEPVLVRTAPTQNNLRVVRAQLIKEKDDKVKTSEPVRQEQVGRVTKETRGRASVALSDLEPGEYALFLKSPLDTDEFSGVYQSSFGDNAKRLQRLIWDFSINSGQQGGM